ncbi:MAG: hypothetical protein AAGD05_02770, partial [Bacteroidota bacterium]
SNLELVLQTGINDFAGMIGRMVLETSKTMERRTCNLNLHAASETYFVNIYNGQVYQVVGVYANYPYLALRAQLEKISQFRNGFQINDRGMEDESYKLYLQYQNQEYIIDLRETPKGSYLSVAKNRKNIVDTTPTSPTTSESAEIDEPLQSEAVQEPIPNAVNSELQIASEPSLESNIPAPPPLLSGTFAFPGKGGQMGCYTGTIKDGQRHGQGVFVAQDGTEWEGQWEANQLVGTVILRKPNGDVYEGAVQNYQRHGYGTYQWRNSSNRFAGDWKNDQREGKATYVIAKNGRRFEGTYVNNRIHGTGTWFYSDGSTLKGNFQKGKKEGRFTATSPDGQQQTCSYERGRLVSSGPLRLVETYGAIECEYIKGLRHGPATITYMDGTVEKRNYKYGKLDGLVSCTYPDGKVQELEYKNDQLLSSGHLKIKRPDGFFEGDFKAGIKEGPGILFLDNEVVEDGNYKAGKKEGAFTLVSPEGDVQILTYKNNQLIHTGPIKLFAADGYFEGRLTEGKKDGPGQFVYTNGNVLEGSWKNDQKEGTFQMRFADGQVAEQVYAADKLEQSRIVKTIPGNCPPPPTGSMSNQSEPIRQEAPLEQTPPTRQTATQAQAPEKPTVTVSDEELVEQFIANFKSVAKDRGYQLNRHTKGSQVHKYSALATNAFFDKGKDYLYVVVFKDCPDCEVTLGRGKDDDLQYKKATIEHEGNFTYAIYSFKSVESNTKPIWAYPDPEEKDGEALLFVR